MIEEKRPAGLDPGEARDTGVAVPRAKPKQPRDESKLTLAAATEREAPDLGAIEAGKAWWREHPHAVALMRALDRFDRDARGAGLDGDVARAARQVIYAGLRVFFRPSDVEAIGIVRRMDGARTGRVPDLSDVRVRAIADAVDLAVWFRRMLDDPDMGPDLARQGFDPISHLRETLIPLLASEPTARDVRDLLDRWVAEGAVKRGSVTTVGIVARLLARTRTLGAKPADERSSDALRPLLNRVNQALARTRDRYT